MDLLFEALARSGTALGVSEFAVATGMPKSTVFRILNTLVALGHIERLGGGRYWFGPRIRALAHDVTTRAHFSAALLPFLIDLYDEVRHPVTLTVLSGSDVMVLHRIHGRRADGLRHEFGVAPAYCTAPGKAMLAHALEDQWPDWSDAELRPRTAATITSLDQLRVELAEIRRTGIAYEQEEFAHGVVAVAVPVLTADRRCVGAIAISGGAEAWPLAKAALALRRTAHEASRILGRGWSPLHG
ncbi:MAG: IclR family transcriptional regulator [Mycobacteriaceae bacterium]|nr:IclR family transcriptional regulator [Mycobacteriaceae bacterium]